MQVNQSAFTLLEVLVAMSILALGMLAMSGLQSSSLRSNQRAYFRTQATIYSVDMGERMQANSRGVNNGDYDNASASASASASGTRFTSECLSFSESGCVPNNLARNDLSEWQAAVMTSLPQGAATVCLDSSPADGSATMPACDGRGDLYAIKIYWDENRDGSVEQNLVMSFRP